MTDTEKQAIERLKEDIKNSDSYDLYSEDMTVCFIEDVETTLNLIEKQQKEIKNWEDHCTVDLEREITELNNENFEYKAEIENKDKIIDEMAEYIVALSASQYVCFVKKSRDEECPKGKLCRTCIKEYFKKKVEDK